MPGVEGAESEFVRAHDRDTECDDAADAGAFGRSLPLSS
jgi:hypothetical protein